MATTTVIVIIIMVWRVCCTPHTLTNIIIVVEVVGRRCTPHILTKVGVEVWTGRRRIHTPHIVMNMMGCRVVWMDCAPHMMGGGIRTQRRVGMDGGRRARTTRSCICNCNG